MKWLREVCGANGNSMVLALWTRAARIVQADAPDGLRVPPDCQAAEGRAVLGLVGLLLLFLLLDKLLLVVHGEG